VLFGLRIANRESLCPIHVCSALPIDIELLPGWAACERSVLRPMNKYAVWMSRPVFVTSTFRDMQAERDWLHAYVFPALAERLRERYRYLEPIDLRWGVEVTGAGGKQAKELLVLKVCLDEIRRSRPFLIGLIGDRYGWTPPPERMRAAAEEAGYGGTLEGRSVTALEIEFGVLESPGQKRAATSACANRCRTARWALSPLSTATSTPEKQVRRKHTSAWRR
jgi:hypothetical protein